jgi:hypothetical protein
MARRQPQDWPRDIEYIPIFEPDMDRMVKALRILLEYNPDKKKLMPYIHRNLPEKRRRVNLILSYNSMLHFPSPSKRKIDSPGRG